jgi:hypothetical protein
VLKSERMSEIFIKYFSADNLRLAWERMIRSNGKDVKDFFGMEVYATNLDKNLEKLSELILNGYYQPQRPFKYYEPKASKTQRTKTVLCIEDALVYQAIADRIAAQNYRTLTENNSFVFGSVLHAEVEKGLELLNEEDPDFYFFEYYIPLYNRFLNSVNNEIENTAIRHKLETDITGFFDCIPHSRLLLTLHQFGLEPEMLDFLADCLNIWSGTRESITAGVGIPQGPAASFFLANLFLYDLDHLILMEGYTYYRYMDDIRIYEETEEKLTEALVLIDNFLKSRALSLNAKKTNTELIGENRESMKYDLIRTASGKEYLVYERNSEGKLYFSDEHSDHEQQTKFIIKSIDDKELVGFCKKEIEEVEVILLDKFKLLGKADFNIGDFLKDDKFNKQIISLAYRWRNANSILSGQMKGKPNDKMVPIWLFCLEHYYWKANHFCWNLNLYGPNQEISKAIQHLMPKFRIYEWVRFQMLSNMSNGQIFDASQLKKLFRDASEEKSPLVRMGYFMILLKQLKPAQQLYASLKKAIRDDSEPYIKNRLALIGGNENSDNIKYWFGL